MHGAGGVCAPRKSGASIAADMLAVHPTTPPLLLPGSAFKLTDGAPVVTPVRAVRAFSQREEARKRRDGEEEEAEREEAPGGGGEEEAEREEGEEGGWW